MKQTEVLGLLGFALSVVVFVLTRWEHRKTLTVDVDCAQGGKFKDESGEYDETMIVIRAMNYCRQIDWINR